ncbi:uncharacterized protein LOC128552736 [Mercenaria mercenaria]|uniref:uncharacterized protein LOC128552736 n=1 Tax=Mercenaria mercenaria TaxID=6596 RepID=UPI00234F6392|nr:uncharacterized protein LOC128552736 [Mercenaria mercenaria]
MSDNVGGRKMLDVGTRQKSSRKTTSSSSDASVPVYASSAEGSVRYKESKKSSIYKSSEEFFEYGCDPCSSAGEHIEAEGFCTDCGEYLCGTCFRSHSRGKATKHHKLLNKDNMPSENVQTCDPCKIAGEEIDAKGYCDDCEEYLCSNCFRSHSRSKATKQHNLMDKENMPKKYNSAIASSVAKIDIHKEDARCQMSKEEYIYVRDINVKVAADTNESDIVAITLVSDHELVLADYNNASLKLIDIDRNVIKGTLDLESKPFGLTTVSKDKVAVLLSNIYVIQIVTVSRTISVQRNIKLMGLCLDIKYLNGKLYASFSKPVRFLILQLSGAVYKTIKPDAEVLKHCTKPDNIAVSPNESVIYVSDWKTNKFICVDMDGNMISMYLHELAIPVDIVITPFGSVYLCSRNQDAIYKMNPDLSEATVILGHRDSLFGPLAMCFNNAKQQLYVSSASSKAEARNQIKVFKRQ